MTRRIILHIGPAKTGTSSLQEALFAAAGELSGHGFEYPSFGRHRFMPQLPGHHGIPAMLRRSGEVPEDVLIGLEQIDPKKTIILSSEDFSVMKSHAIERMCDKIQPAHVEIVYYARRWDQLLPSVWQELIKHGQSLPYLDFVNNQLSDLDESHYLNYAIPLRRWSSVLGHQSLSIYAYDNVLASGGDVVSHFFSKVLGVKLSRMNLRRENPRWPTERLEVLRVLNRLHFGNGKPDSSVRAFLTDLRAAGDEELAALERQLRPFVIKSSPHAPDLMRSVETRFMREFRSQLRNPGEDGDLFIDTPLIAAKYIRSDYLIETDALDRLQSFYNRFEKPRAINA